MSVIKEYCRYEGDKCLEDGESDKYVNRDCGSCEFITIIPPEAIQEPDPLGSAGFELLSASNDPEKLRMALRNLLDASKPYLRRKKMTPRNDCAFLNSAHEKGEKLLAT